MQRKPLITIFLIVFIDLLGFGLILPLLPFIAEKFEADPFQIGLLVATYSFFQFISAPILGRLSDRYGRKKLLVISQIGTAIGFFLLGIAQTLPLLYLSRIIDGITGGNISIAQAYIADITTKKDRAKGMGVIGAAFGLGFMLGPAVGGYLSNFSFAAPAFFATVVALFTALMTILFLQETVNTKKAVKSQKTEFSFQTLIQILSQQPLGLLILVFFMISLAFSGLQATYALWALDKFGFGPSQIGYLFTYIGLLAVISQILILPRVVKRLGEAKTIKYSLPIIAVGFLMIPFSIHLALLLIANALIVIGNSLSSPSISALASENVDEKEFGGALGILQSGASLGRILGPILGGILFARFSPNAPFVISGGILILTSLLCIRYLSENSTPLKKFLNKIHF